MKVWPNFLPTGGGWLIRQTTRADSRLWCKRFPIRTGGTGVHQRRYRAAMGRRHVKELYFIAPDGKLMAASISASSANFETTTPVPLFPAQVAGGVTNLFRPQYAVSRDGRFLINQLAEESTATPITLILNWKPTP